MSQAGEISAAQDTVKNQISFADLRDANRNRIDTRAFNRTLHDWVLSQWSNAIAGEVGELCNLVKKLERGDAQTFDKGAKIRLDFHAIAAELADVIIYADLFAQRLGVNLGDVVREKFNRTSEKIGSAVRL